MDAVTHEDEKYISLRRQSRGSHTAAQEGQKTNRFARFLLSAWSALGFLGAQLQAP